MNSAATLVIGSEIALSLYPILIKKVPTTLDTQLLSRFLTFTVAAALLNPGALLPTWGTWKGIQRSAGLGAITIAHVASSYYAFKELPAGPAMALFYTYPIMNLLGGMLVFGETASPLQLGLMALCFLGVIAVAFGSAHATSKSEEGEQKEIHWKGVAAALAAAFTEVLMYFAVRTAKQPDPYFATLELYPGALLGFGIWLLASGRLGGVSRDPATWVPMTLFNLCIGFVGYALRFYTIPKISTIVFSLLSFFGVAASFAFGYLFVGEVPSVLSSLGAALIVLTAALTSKF